MTHRDHRLSAPQVPALGVVLAALMLVGGCASGGRGGGDDPGSTVAAAPSRGGRSTADTVRLAILGTTDVHGRIGDRDAFTGGPSPEGLARVATLVDSIRAADPHVLLLDSGDLLQGSPFTAYFAREDTLFEAAGGVHPVIAAMNALEYDASAIGNHEFNYGLPFLRRALAGAEFPFLAANVVRAGTDEPVWTPYAVLQVGPLRVGVIGFTTPGVMVWDRAHVEGRVEVRDILESADHWLPRLAAEEPDLIVVTMHSGLDPRSTYPPGAAPLEDAGRPLAERHPEIDVVLFGHTHRDTPEARVGDVLFAQAEKWGRRLAVVDVTVAREDGAWRVVDKVSRTLSTEGVPPDPELLRVVERPAQAVDAFIRTPIARSTAPWTATTARLEDTPLVDLIQQVQLEATGADLSSTAVFNTDARLPAGPVTVADLAALYPYENTLKAIRIDGTQLREYLEASARYFRRMCRPDERPATSDCVAPDGAAPGAPPGAGVARGQGGTESVADPDVPGYNYDVLAGVDYALDLSRPAGSRVVRLERNGRDVAPADSFTLALNSYRQAGGGGFEMLTRAPVVVDGREDVRELIVDWVRERGTISPEDVFRRNWRLAPEPAVARLLATAPEPPRGGAVALDADEEREPEACSAYRGAPADSIVHLTVLATNDFHGALDEKVYPWSEGRAVGGAPALAAAIAEARSENPSGTLLLDGGDVMQGTPISNLVQGRSVIDVYNAIGYDAAAVGNHEFDWGIDTLRARMAQARFPFLTANVVLAADSSRPEWAVPSRIVERKGVRVGLIGLTTRATPSTTLPTHVEHLAFTDLAGAVGEAAAELKADGADLVVVVAHAGGFFNPDSARFEGEIVEAMAQMSPDTVDLVVSGHTHSLLDGEVGGIALVQARSSGTALGTVDLFVDPDSRDVVCSDVRVETVFADERPPADSVAAIVRAYQAEIDSVTRRVVGTAAHRLTAHRRRESVLGDLIADAQRAATGTQIALMNSGGIRAEIDEGPITWREAFEVQPFANILYKMELDGRTLRAALENGVEGGHGIVQVSGLRFSVDAQAPEGGRVSDVVLEDGTPVHDDSTYTATVNNFLAQGGDGYTMLRDAPAVENTGLIDLDVFVEHLDALPQPIRYDLQGRIRFLGEPVPERRAF